MAPKVGDTVSFHMIAMHLCGGGGGKLSQDVIDRRLALGLPEQPPAQCQCATEAMSSYPADVIAVHDLESGEPQCLELEVAMPAEVTALGYATRQSSSPEARTTPPESGTWSQ